MTNLRSGDRRVALRDQVSRMTARILVVSHPAVLPVNQTVYRVLAERGWDVRIVVPDRWRHEYADGLIRPQPLEGLESALLPLPIVLPGAPQRHFYRVWPAHVLQRTRPDVAFLEQEPFSLSALQWGLAASRASIPFGVQADENLDRHYPLPVRRYRRWVLRHARFVAARSPTAARLVSAWGAAGAVGVAPHAVPAWPATSEPHRISDGVFTIGYAGRLVPEKGIRVLVKAVAALDGPVRLLVAGDGPQVSSLRDLNAPHVQLEHLPRARHEDMAGVFRRMDVLVLPSLTTSTWTEQFGRVLVEAMSQQVPVIGSDSGEIPWVVQTTGGGILVPEGDVEALAGALRELRADSAKRATLGARGRAGVDRLFSASAAACALEDLLRSALRVAA